MVSPQFINIILWAGLGPEHHTACCGRIPDRMSYLSVVYVNIITCGETNGARLDRRFRSKIGVWKVCWILDQYQSRITTTLKPDGNGIET